MILKMLALYFHYKNKEYCALVRLKEMGKLSVTIMNGDLERKFYGYHNFSYRNGWVEVEQLPEEKDTLYLQNIVRDALQRHLEGNGQLSWNTRMSEA